MLPAALTAAPRPPAAWRGLKTNFVSEQVHALVNERLEDRLLAKRRERFMAAADELTARLDRLPDAVPAAWRVCAVPLAWATRDLLSPLAVDGCFATSAAARDALEGLAGNGRVLALLPADRRREGRVLSLPARSIRAVVESALDEAVADGNPDAMRAAVETADFLAVITSGPAGR